MSGAVAVAGGDLDGDYFDYGSIGVYENISEMRKNGMEMFYFVHLNGGPAFIVAKKAADILHKEFAT